MSDALSAMMRLDENEIGGFGAGGIVEVRLLEDILKLQMLLAFGCYR